MPSITEEVAVLEQQHKWEKLFQEIKIKSSQYDLPYKVSKMIENRNKNRYRDVSPFDHSRVKLIDGPNDYINSSLVEVDKAGRRYILSQGPLPITSGHLWQMVWEQNSKSIIMLNKIIEKGARKCHQYWPLEKNNTMLFEDEGYEVSLKNETDKRNFIIRELVLKEIKTPKQESRVIFQFHYTAWPDFGVPESPTAFLDFLACVREHNVLESYYGPAVIHCSAGIGRSGTFALVDTCLVFLEKGIPFDIHETLLEMRKYRMGLIQTSQQLRFSYFAIAECEKILLSKQDEDSNVGAGYNTDDDEHHSGEDNHDNGDNKDDHTNNVRNSEAKENRKRHGDPNGPNDEKRGKQEKIYATEALINSIDNNNIKDDLRQRKTEKKEALKKQVEQIKRNMKASEGKWPWKHYVIGGIVATVAIGLAVRYWYYA